MNIKLLEVIRQIKDAGFLCGLIYSGYTLNNQRHAFELRMSTLENSLKSKIEEFALKHETLKDKFVSEGESLKDLVSAKVEAVKSMSRYDAFYTNENTIIVLKVIGCVIVLSVCGYYSYFYVVDPLNKLGAFITYYLAGLKYNKPKDDCDDEVFTEGAKAEDSPQIEYSKVVTIDISSGLLVGSEVKNINDEVGVLELSENKIDELIELFKDLN